MTVRTMAGRRMSRPSVRQAASPSVRRLLRCYLRWLVRSFVRSVFVVVRQARGAVILVCRSGTTSMPYVCDGVRSNHPFVHPSATTDDDPPPVSLRRRRRRSPRVICLLASSALKTRCSLACWLNGWLVARLVGRGAASRLGMCRTRAETGNPFTNKYFLTVRFWANR